MLVRTRLTEAMKEKRKRHLGERDVEQKVSD
jgi:hypothetical protein